MARAKVQLRSESVARREPAGEYGVLVSFDPIEPQRKIFGVDERQAVRLGMRFLAARVADL